AAKMRIGKRRQAKARRGKQCFATPIIAGILLDLGWPPASLFYLVAAPLIVGALAHFTLQKFYGARRAAETQSPAEPLGE
ncbi:MAG: hypothetical protein RJB62_1591, partial [Pseudomonadota bacterium]